MEKTIYDIMSNDTRRIDAFKAACDDMMQTQYILVDNKITNVLQAISVCKPLYTLFGGILQDFDYKAVAKSCLINDETEFKMPQDPKKIAALAFCILLDMDKKNIEIKDFLLFFRRGGDTNSAYDNFLREVIAPFKNSVIFLLHKAEDDIALKQAEEESQKEKQEEEQAFNKVLNMFIARIYADNSLSQIIKDYLCGLFTDLLSALKNNEAGKAKNIYNILNKRLKTHKPSLSKEFEKIDLKDLAELCG